jgi:predicted porin
LLQLRGTLCAKSFIVALAALAATASFAQSTVTIGGIFDAGYKNTSAQDATASKKEFTGNNTATSQIFFTGSEDLGGGLKGEFKGVALINTVSGQTGNGSTPFSTNQNVLNDEIWVGASGGFGSVKIGAPNSAMLETNGKVQPFGTAMAGGYQSVGINRLGAGVSGYGVNQFVGGGSANGRVVRNEKTLRYDTPVFNGFSASLAYAAKNANKLSNNSTSNSNGYTDFGLNYSNGPLNLAYANTKIEAGAYSAAGNITGIGFTGTAVTTAQATTGFTTAYAPAGTNAYTQAAALAPNASVRYQMFGGNYTLGAATLYAGFTTGKGTGVTMDVKSWNAAVKYALNANVDLMANYVKVDDKLSAADQKLTGLGVDYKFSKRTAAYVRYEDYNTNTSAANAGVKNTAVGIRHTF